MSRPIIAITAGRRRSAAGTDETQGVWSGVSVDYVEAVVRSGGAPVLLPRTSCPDLVAESLARADALLLSGGGDVVSLAFGEEPHPSARYQDAVLDDMETRAVQVALARELPILGICRGIQVLNVALGGTLVQDVPTQVPNALLHSTRARASTLVHTIDIEPDSQLARMLGVTSTPVNSFHHQAVGRVAPGLRVTARARDGVIEAIEAADSRPVVGVQFHPEECAADYPLLQRVFDWLVAVAQARRG